MTHTRVCTHGYTNEAPLNGVAKTNQFNFFLFSETNVKTDLFSVDQRLKTKTCFYVEFELEVDTQMSQRTRANAVAFTM